MKLECGRAQCRIGDKDRRVEEMRPETHKYLTVPAERSKRIRSIVAEWIPAAGGVWFCQTRTFSLARNVCVSLAHREISQSAKNLLCHTQKRATPHFHCFFYSISCSLASTS